MPCYHMLFMHGKLDDMHQGMQGVRHSSELLNMYGT